MKKILYIAIVLFSNLVIAQNNELFKKANSLYNDGEFQESIKTYEQILSTGVHSSELYFNLANAYYKLNQTASSIYYFEKAKQLSPKDKDIENNLLFAQNMTLDKIDNIPETGISKILRNIIDISGFEGWAQLSLVFVFLFVIFFLSYYFSFSTVKKRISFVSSFIVLLFAVSTLFFAFQKEGYHKKDRPAIVFAQESAIKSEPNLRSETAFILHEGAKVQVLETYNENWAKVKIASGETGWIATQDIKEVKNF